MPAELYRDPLGGVRSGTLAVSWGANGGFYFNKGYCVRLCLWRVAITYIPRDLDAVLEDSLAKWREGRQPPDAGAGKAVTG